MVNNVRSGAGVEATEDQLIRFKRCFGEHPGLTLIGVFNEHEVWVDIETQGSNAIYCIKCTEEGVETSYGWTHISGCNNDPLEERLERTMRGVGHGNSRRESYRQAILYLGAVYGERFCKEYGERFCSDE